MQMVVAGLPDVAPSGGKVRSPCLLYRPQFHSAGDSSQDGYCPRAHRLLYEADAVRLARPGQRLHPARRQAAGPELARAAGVRGRGRADARRREFAAGGRALLHGRCLHSGSENHSGSIRHAVFYDAVRRDCSPFHGAYSAPRAGRRRRRRVRRRRRRHGRAGRLGAAGGAAGRAALGRAASWCG